MAKTATRRDNQGRFTLGSGGGPGRPRRQTEAGYLSVLMEACDLDAWRSIVERAVVDARDGNEKARQWLASYLVGAPGTAAPAPTTIVVQQLLRSDPALDQAAKVLAQPVIHNRRYPLLRDDDEADKGITAEARSAILAAQQPDNG